jgi:flotillin
LAEVIINTTETLQGIIPIIVTGLGILLFLATFYFILFTMFYKKPKQGQALVRVGLGGTKVAIGSGIFSIPSFHQLETLDISMKKIRIECLGDRNLICKDNLRADVKAAFYVRVKREAASIAKVAQIIGAANASRTETIKELFEPKFTAALKTTARKFELEGLLETNKEFRDELLDILGIDLHGFVLEDCAVDYFEKTSEDRKHTAKFME